MIHKYKFTENNGGYPINQRGMKDLCIPLGLVCLEQNTSTNLSLQNKYDYLSDVNDEIFDTLFNLVSKPKSTIKHNKTKKNIK